ncbi:hypothetical protein Ddc_20680 [Ditylenchus destructor]|nr:hypothetical protein Ddc_20680 [Ditylenchus destructor]
MYACPKCSSPAFEHLHELEVHLVIEHFPQLLIYQCHFSQCAYARFPTELTLIDHYLDAHGAVKTLQDGEKIQITYSTDLSILRAKAEVNDFLIQASIARNKPRLVLITEMESSENSSDSQLQQLPTPATNLIPIPIDDQRSVTEGSGVPGSSANVNYLADVPIPLIHRKPTQGTKRLAGNLTPSRIQKRGISVPKNTQQLFIPPFNPKRRCRSQTPGRELGTQVAKEPSTFSLYVKEHKSAISRSAKQKGVHFMTPFGAGTVIQRSSSRTAGLRPCLLGAASQFYKSFKANAFQSFATPR